MTSAAPVPVPDGTTPPAEAVEAAMKAREAHQISWTRWGGSATHWACKCGMTFGQADGYAASHRHPDEVAAAAVVAALEESGWTPTSQTGCAGCSDLPGREREAAAKALEEAADRWQQGDGFTVMAPKGVGIPAIDYAQRALDWLRARASALREGRD